MVVNLNAQTLVIFLSIFFSVNGNGIEKKKNNKIDLKPDLFFLFWSHFRLCLWTAMPQPYIIVKGMLNMIE